VTRLRRFNSILGERASRANVTAFLPTAQTILLCLVLSLPVPILLLFLGWRLQTASQHASFPQAASLGLQVAARYFFSLEFLRQAVRRGGLAESHFQWSTDVCRMLRNNLRWFLDVAVLMVGTVAILSSAADQPWESSLGRMLFVALMLICSCLFLRILRPKSGVLANYLKSHPGGWADRLRFLWYAGFGSAPLALAALSWFGYHYTALRLAMHLHTSVIAMVGMLLLHAMLRRWLWLSRRKILLSQARSRLEVAQKRDPHAPFSGLSHNKEDFDLQEINAQTMRLITSGMVVSVFAALLFIWSGVMPAVSALDAIPLWNVEGATPDKPIPITLAHLLLSIPLLAMTLVAARNLPGLLEIALLQHLPLENAVRYAIATLSRYTIFILGIAITFNTVGVRWSSIQWLVAALGVGLGFGLQEIFANFISGLILLFEQPIRVGDVITLGDTTGSVSRIRMRATTITNWDRQELIIPNKDLITGRLLNWTLSDSTNRVKLQLGIAYGSDTERACQILTQICTSHPNVMKEPLPAAHFESFGDNSLNIVVRLFLANLDLRLQTRHELLTEIHRRFQEAAIEISFPQRDLHIRSLPQSVLQWLSREPSTPIPSAIPATMPRAAGSASSSPLVK
jgi:potassium efflux system protein